MPLPVPVMRVTLALGLLSSACVPVRVWEVPELKGIVHRGEGSVANAKVLWLNIRHGSREPPTVAGQAMTNGRGEFEMAPVTRYAAGVLLPAHSMSESLLQLEVNGTATRLWHYKFYAARPRSAPRRVALDCDLERAPPCALLDTDNPWLSKTERLSVE